MEPGTATTFEQGATQANRAEEVDTVVSRAQRITAATNDVGIARTPADRAGGRLEVDAGGFCDCRCLGAVPNRCTVHFCERRVSE